MIRIKNINLKKLTLSNVSRFLSITENLSDTGSIFSALYSEISSFPLFLKAIQKTYTQFGIVNRNMKYS